MLVVRGVVCSISFPGPYSHTRTGLVSISGHSQHCRPGPHQAQRSPQNQAHKLTWALTSFFSSCLIFALTEQIFVPSGQIEQTQFGCHRLGLQTERLWSHSPPCPPYPTMSPSLSPSETESCATCQVHVSCFKEHRLRDPADLSLIPALAPF